MRVRSQMLCKPLRVICLSLISQLYSPYFTFFFKSDGSPSQWEIEETVRFKELYDQDKDGKLNREEQLRWVAPNSYGSAREEVRFCGSFVWPYSVGIINEILLKEKK